MYDLKTLNLKKGKEDEEKKMEKNEKKEEDKKKIKKRRKIKRRKKKLQKQGTLIRTHICVMFNDATCN